MNMTPTDRGEEDLFDLIIEPIAGASGESETVHGAGVSAQVEAVISPKKPGVRLYGEGSEKIKTLDDLRAVMAAKGDTAEGELLPIELPSADLPQVALFAARNEVISKLYELVIATLEGLFEELEDGKRRLRLRNEVPVQGMTSTGYSGADIEVLTDDMDRLINVRDPHFNEAIAHKELGVIALLKTVVDAINRNGDPQAVFIAFRNLGLRINVGVRYPLGTEQVVRREFASMDLAELPWEGENPVLSRRNVLQERVDENFKYPEYFRIVAGDIKIFQQKFGAQFGLLRTVMQSMSAATRIVHTSRYFNAMWQYKIMHELTNEAPFMTAPMVAALKALGVEFDGFAKSFKEKQGLPKAKSAMEDLIEKFATETMTPLIAAAKAANGAMQLMRDALAGSSSVSEVQEILRKLASEQLPAFATTLGEESGAHAEAVAAPGEKKTTLKLNP